MKKAIILILIIFVGCNNSNNDNLTVKYYSSFAGYEHPVKLTDELNENQIKDRRAYMIGTFVNGKLIKVEKILDNKSSFTYNYKYDKNGKISDVKIFKPNK